MLVAGVHKDWPKQLELIKKMSKTKDVVPAQFLTNSGPSALLTNQTAGLSAICMTPKGIADSDRAIVAPNVSRLVSRVSSAAFFLLVCKQTCKLVHRSPRAPLPPLPLPSHPLPPLLVAAGSSDGGGISDIRPRV